MIPTPYAQLVRVAAPQIILVLTALIVMALDLLARTKPLHTRFTLSLIHI